MAELEDDLALKSIGRYFGVPKQASVSIRKAHRLYSTTWVVSVSEGALSETYLVKFAREGAEKQVRLAQRANEIFIGYPVHVPSEIQYDPEHDLIVSRAFPGRSLEALMADRGWPNPVRWYGDLSRTLHLAGLWLRRYHQVDRHPGSLSEPLMHYLERRRDKLDRLSPDSRRKLLRLVGGDIIDNVVVTHSDFSPGNILSNGRALCVVDFGIAEWTEMSPWWDVVTLLISLDRYFLFRRLTPLYWVRPLIARLKDRFRAAYEQAPPEDHRPVLACAAVRHFSFAGNWTADALRNDPRARWHAEQLERILDKV